MYVYALKNNKIKINVNASNVGCCAVIPGC